ANRTSGVVARCPFGVRRPTPVAPDEEVHQTTTTDEMRIVKSLALGAALCVPGLLVAAAPASAAGPQPPTCSGPGSNDGQTAALAHSFIGANGQPGLSSFNHGAAAAFIASQQQANCGF